MFPVSFPSNLIVLYPSDTFVFVVGFVLSNDQIKFWWDPGSWDRSHVYQGLLNPWLMETTDGIYVANHHCWLSFMVQKCFIWVSECLSSCSWGGRRKVQSKKSGRWKRRTVPINGISGVCCVEGDYPKTVDIACWIKMIHNSETRSDQTLLDGNLYIIKLTFWQGSYQSWLMITNVRLGYLPPVVMRYICDEHWRLFKGGLLRQIVCDHSWFGELSTSSSISHLFWASCQESLTNINHHWSTL